MFASTGVELRRLPVAKARPPKKEVNSTKDLGKFRLERGRPLSDAIIDGYEVNA